MRGCTEAPETAAAGSSSPLELSARVEPAAVEGEGRVHAGGGNGGRAGGAKIWREFVETKAGWDG